MYLAGDGAVVLPRHYGNRRKSVQKWKRGRTGVGERRREGKSGKEKKSGGRENVRVCIDHDVRTHTGPVCSSDSDQFTPISGRID